MLFDQEFTKLCKHLTPQQVRKMIIKDSRILISHKCICLICYNRLKRVSPNLTLVGITGNIKKYVFDTLNDLHFIIVEKTLKITKFFLEFPFCHILVGNVTKFWNVWWFSWRGVKLPFPSYLVELTYNVSWRRIQNEFGFFRLDYREFCQMIHARQNKK